MLLLYHHILKSPRSGLKRNLLGCEGHLIEITAQF